MLVKDSTWPFCLCYWPPLCSPDSKTVLVFSPLPFSLLLWVYVSFVNPLLSTIHLSPTYSAGFLEVARLVNFFNFAFVMLVFQRLPAFCPELYCCNFSIFTCLVSLVTLLQSSEPPSLILISRLFHLKSILCNTTRPVLFSKHSSVRHHLAQKACKLCLLTLYINGSLLPLRSGILSLRWTLPTLRLIYEFFMLQ